MGSRVHTPVAKTHPRTHSQTRRHAQTQVYDQYTCARGQRHTPKWFPRAETTTNTKNNTERFTHTTQNTGHNPHHTEDKSHPPRPTPLHPNPRPPHRIQPTPARPCPPWPLPPPPQAGPPHPTRPHPDPLPAQHRTAQLTRLGASSTLVSLRPREPQEHDCGEPQPQCGPSFVNEPLLHFGRVGWWHRGLLLRGRVVTRPVSVGCDQASVKFHVNSNALVKSSASCWPKVVGTSPCLLASSHTLPREELNMHVRHHRRGKQLPRCGITTVNRLPNRSKKVHDESSSTQTNKVGH